MTTSPTPDPLIELAAALKEADALDPPIGLAARVASAAFADRPPGQVLHEPEPVSSDVAFKRSVDALDQLLADLEESEWQCLALRGLNVQGLVGHLIGVELDFQRALLGRGESHPLANHVEATEAHALGQRDRSPDATHAEWHQYATRSLELVRQHSMSAEISLHGVVAALDALLIVRTFELWTHADDIRRVTNRALVTPDPSSLQKMVDLAVQLLPDAWQRVSGAQAPLSARLVLIGEAGGTFNVHLRDRHQGTPGVRIVAETVTFCRLVANRISVEEAALSVAGDRAIADDLFAGAITLALD